jgi:hypothetical protein
MAVLAGNERSKTVLIETLLWVEQWLTLLHPAGFPNSIRLIRDTTARRNVTEAELMEAATIVEKATRHLSHESLTKLRAVVAA